MPLVHVEPGDSEDEELVTVVEKEKLDIEKKVLTVQDKFRTVEKVLMVENLEDFLLQGWKLIFIICGWFTFAKNGLLMCGIDDYS